MTAIQPAESNQTIRQTLGEINDQLWYKPRYCLELAQRAYVAAPQFPAQLKAECAVALGAALNEAGRFAETATCLPDAVEALISHEGWESGLQCYSENIIACSYLGQFKTAYNLLAQARECLTGRSIPLAEAYCDRAAGILQREQNNYAEAITSLQRALNIFRSTSHSGEVARTQYELIISLRFIDVDQALDLLNELHALTVIGDSSVHLARCDYLLAILHQEMNIYHDSMPLVENARSVFKREHMNFHLALCDLSDGNTHYRLNHYSAAGESYHHARAIFDMLLTTGYISLCDFNIAIVLIDKNHYTEALELLQQVAESARLEGRSMRAARCYGNMGLCHDRLGQYDQALMMHQRAYAACRQSNEAVFAAHYEENLAGTYRRLGHYIEARQHYQHAHKVFAEYQLPTYAALCDTHLADLHLALSEYDQALLVLADARQLYLQQGLAVYAAICDREMGRALIYLDRSAEALQLLERANLILTDQNLLIDLALCEVARGEALIELNQIARAVDLFSAALTTLTPAFPDEAWRAEFGLGRCALIRDDRLGALQHWLIAIKLVHQMRSALPTERLSGGFFADRHKLYESTVQLAINMGDIGSALSVIEASKAQTFSGWDIDRNQNDSDRDDPFMNDLIKRAEELRQEIETLRHQLRLLQADEAGPVLRSVGDILATQPRALARLTGLSREYEQIIEQLRLIDSPQTRSAASLFSVEAFRVAAEKYLQPRWACLAYYLFADQLFVFYFDANQLRIQVKPLTTFDLTILRQCTAPSTDYRELIYHGSLRGQRTPNRSGNKQLQHLYQLLVPAEVEKLDPSDILIIAPHGALHGLPFHALLGPNGILAVQSAITYVPSLSAFQILLTRDVVPFNQHQQLLACGLADYGDRARSLLHAEQELATLQEVWGSQLTTWWGESATRARLLQANDTRQLQAYDLLHFTAHAVLDQRAPTLSRVLLADGDLTFTDILQLRLNAPVVTLSTCDSAAGQAQLGDELMTLARAFFLAGARTLVASLWPVEDISTTELMRRFYTHLSTGLDVSHSLRAAQIELAAEGYSPFQWAPFIVIGLP
jgi:CHAT domain-containing protein